MNSDVLQFVSKSPYVDGDSLASLVNQESECEPPVREQRERKFEECHTEHQSQYQRVEQ